MKNNNFQLPQNILNNSLNKNPSQIQNFNYMIHLYPDNSNMYNIQNLAYPLYQLNYLQNNPQYQLLSLANMQNVYPLYYNIAYNNLLRFNLLNYNKNLSSNPNLLANISNLSNFQNNLQNNILLNKKTFNQDHREFDVETTINEKKGDNKDIKDIKDNNGTNNIKEENEISPEKKEDKSKYEIKSEIKTENNSEDKSLEEAQDKNIINENKISEEKNGEKNDDNNEKNEISTSNHEEKIDEEKKEIKKEQKKKKKRRTNYKELLYDPLLEQIGKEEKNKNKNNELEEETSSINESTKKKEKNKKPQNSTQKTRQKPKTKNGRHSRKKQHKITLKNNKDILADLEENKNEEDNSKFTKVIFHGKDYKETKNVSDFMKYNFDFIIDEQYKSKKLITDYDQQHIDEKTINGNANIYDNYNYSEQHLDEIKSMWSRGKFLGDNKELKRAINVVRDTFNERKIYSNEEKYLNIIKNNNYCIDDFENKKN